jgi:hypothetical protein
MNLYRYFPGMSQDEGGDNNTPLLNRDGIRLLVWAKTKSSTVKQMNVLIMADYVYQEYVFAVQHIDDNRVLASRVLQVFERGTISPVAMAKRLFVNTLPEADLNFITSEIQKDAVRQWTWGGQE